MLPSFGSIALLPPTLLALLVAAEPKSHPNPTAIRKLSPDSNQKLFPEHLAFAPIPEILPTQSSSYPFAPSIEDEDDYNLTSSNGTILPRFYRRAFAAHYGDESHEGVLRRAAEALSILERRASCPTGMNSCDDIKAPNKCCQEGTYCTDVTDTDVGHVACCPKGSTCDGAVGECPSDAVSCPASLGGGCCIAGYVCQGVGCVIPGSSTATTEVSKTTTKEKTTTTTEQEGTTTEAETTTIEESSTEESTTEEATSTETSEESETESETATETGTGGAPYRPTMTSAPESDEPTQTGCPTGFYGCLATHGGGCCRTDRNCETYSCPAPSSTTIASGQATIVVPATNLPESSTTETCASGWFLCGKSGGPTAGCCPSGYECGTASCFTVEASQTGKVQKEFPEDSDGVVISARLSLLGFVFVLMMLL